MYYENLDPPEHKHPVCPVCGWECDTVIKDVNGNVIGCDNCLDIQDAWSWMEDELEETA